MHPSQSSLPRAACRENSETKQIMPEKQQEWNQGQKRLLSEKPLPIARRIEERHLIETPEAATPPKRAGVASANSAHHSDLNMK